MRLFIAFEIPEIYDHFILKSQEAILAKASFPKSFHLTLKFLGEVEESRLGILVSSLDKVRFAPFDAYFSGVGCFPDERVARVVWFALEPKDKIAEVQKKIESATEGFGISQQKAFVPHITVARIKQIGDKDVFSGSLEKLNIPTDPFTVSEFKLFRSTLTPGGPVYEVLGVFKAQ